jgi:predicted NBD/HSP70 family sugar kinase
MSRTPSTGGSGISFEDVRRRNLSTIFRLVHYAGNMTRADLTEATGLNRSTVSDLVAELVHGGLLEERPAAIRLGKGRPSLTVTPTATLVALTVHLEVNGVVTGLVGLGGRVLTRTRRRTRRVPGIEETIDLARSSLAELRASLGRAMRLVGVGATVPGLVRVTDGVVRHAPHLGWDDVNLGAALAEALGAPTGVANDANAIVEAERLFGAGRGLSTIVLFNGDVSGIGGGVVIGGRLVEGASGYTGELGQTLLSPPTGVAGRTISRNLEDEVNLRDLMHALGRSTSDDAQLDDLLAAADDDRLVKLVRYQLGVLSLPVSWTVNVFNPEVVVLGGFLGSLYATDPAFFSSLVRRQALPPAYQDVRIVRASLGGDARMIGAAELGFREVLDNPVPETVQSILLA